MPYQAWLQDHAAGLVQVVSLQGWNPLFDVSLQHLPPQEPCANVASAAAALKPRVAVLRISSSVHRLLPVISILIAVAAAGFLWHHLRHIQFAQVWATLSSYPPWVLLGALSCAAMSFALLGVYEALMLRVVGQPLGWRRPMLVSTIATPIGHAVGLAALTAGAMRYRLYAKEGVSKGQVARLVVLTAMPFFLGMMLLIDLVLVFGAPQAALALHLPESLLVGVGCLGLLKDLGVLIFVALCKKPFSLGKLFIGAPSLPLTLMQWMLGVCEILLVATVLYLLMPRDIGLSIAGFLAAYLIGIIISQASHVPAGLGVLEASLLLMMPQVAPERLLAGVLAYRIIFEVLPLVVALVLLAWHELGSRRALLPEREEFEASG
jgi:uncharacterized membrane protein YbhN (UPF0104 family)